MKMKINSNETKDSSKSCSPLSVVSLTNNDKKSRTFHEYTNHVNNPTTVGTKIESIVNRLFPSNQDKDCNHSRRSCFTNIEYDVKTENKIQKVNKKQIVIQKQKESEQYIPSNEELFVIGWSKAYDRKRGLYYYYTLDRSRVTWKNPLQRNL